jgi:hypothetical protein
VTDTPVAVFTSVTQGALPIVTAFAEGAVIIEIAESAETAKTKGINEATKRRALRMKVARFNAIPMYSFTGAAGDCPFLTRKCLNEWNLSPQNSPPPSAKRRGARDSRHGFAPRNP